MIRLNIYALKTYKTTLFHINPLFIKCVWLPRPKPASSKMKAHKAHLLHIRSQYGQNLNTSLRENLKHDERLE